MESGNNIRYIGDGFCLTAYSGSTRVAFLRSVLLEDGIVLLGEIRVFPEANTRTGFFADLVRKILPDYGQIRPRRLGIGSELLTRFLAKCRREGVKEVFGNVTPADSRSQPFLREWYRKFGFHTTPPDGRAEYFAVEYKIVWKQHPST